MGLATFDDGGDDIRREIAEPHHISELAAALVHPGSNLRERAGLFEHGNLRRLSDARRAALVEALQPVLFPADGWMKGDERVWRAKQVRIARDFHIFFHQIKSAGIENQFYRYISIYYIIMIYGPSGS